VATLLDTGRHLQARDADPKRTAARDTIRAVWFDVMSRSAPAASRVDLGIWLGLMLDAYDAPDRHYHGLVHIADLLTGLEAQAARAANRDAVALAILYHDLVYDPRRRDNEDASAARAAIALAALGADGDLTARVAHLVRATAHALTPATVDGDTALLLDLDLCVLGAACDRYETYVAAVRREYAHLGDEAWRTGRANVLRQFLARPQVFRTAWMAAALEARARVNLTRELDHLTAMGPAHRDP
jgi:predicted metal-dependent HD superfamily phosphohydrolase